MGKDKSKLDICPFCGSDAEVVEVDTGCIVVRCKECNVSGDYYVSEHAARAAWDDRRGFYKKRVLIGLADGLLSTAVIAFALALLCAIAYLL